MPMLAQRHVGLAGHARRVLGLLEEGDDAVLLVDVHDAEARRLLRGTSRQPTVTSAPASTCCCSISS